MKEFTLQKVKVAALVAAAVVGLFLMIAQAQPEDYRVERSIATKVAPAAIFSVLSDFQRFGEWSPWEKLDPNMNRKFGGTPGTVGCTYEWDGNDEVGAGKMTIVEVLPGDKVRIKLEFLRPFPSESEVIWSVQESGDETKISWIMTGKNSNLVSKIFSLIMDMDAMIGKDFEKGLTQLKSVVEGVN